MRERPGVGVYLTGGLLQVNEKKTGKEKILAELLHGPALAQTDLGNPLASSSCCRPTT